MEEPALAHKQARLQELRTRYYQAQQCLQNLSQKYPTASAHYQLFAAPLFSAQRDPADQKLFRLRLPGMLAGGLRDLEAWEYAWLSVVRPAGQGKSASNAVGRLTDGPVSVPFRESDNVNVALIDTVRRPGEDKFTWAFSRNELMPSRGNAGELDLVLAKVEAVDTRTGKVAVRTDEDLTQLRILDFKVYHPVVESVTNLA